MVKVSGREVLTVLVLTGLIGGAIIYRNVAADRKADEEFRKSLKNARDMQSATGAAEKRAKQLRDDIDARFKKAQEDSEAATARAKNAQEDLEASRKAASN